MTFWLCVDPGETTGYSIWKGSKLLWADQMPMWEFARAVYKWADTGDLRDLAPDLEGAAGTPLHAIVCEDWKLYPWVISAGGLDFDSCRTARVIGAITLTCQVFGIKFVLQGADIKKGAQAAGAESLYLEPIHENRHANDSIQHGVYWLALHSNESP